jgi:GWT1
VIISLSSHPFTTYTSSTLGYLAIHLLGLSTGTLLLPPSPKFFRRRLKAALRRDSDARDTLGVARQNDKTATELCSYTVVWWALLGATYLFGMGDVSRRMVRSFIFQIHICFFRLTLNGLTTGEPAICIMGGGVQHEFPSRLPFARSNILPFATVEIRVLEDVEA